MRDGVSKQLQGAECATASASSFRGAECATASASSFRLLTRQQQARGPTGRDAGCCFPTVAAGRAAVSTAAAWKMVHWNDWPSGQHALQLRCAVPMGHTHTLGEHCAASSIGRHIPRGQHSIGRHIPRTDGTTMADGTTMDGTRWRICDGHGAQHGAMALAERAVTRLYPKLILKFTSQLRVQSCTMQYYLFIGNY